MKKSFAVLVLLSACVLSASGTVAASTTKPERLTQTELFYQPNLAQRDVQIFKAGDEILSAPTMWGMSAKLENSVVLKTSKGPVEIASGEVMPATLISGMPGFAPRITAYCTKRRIADKATAGLFFGKLGASLAETWSNGQKCVFDADDDGVAELGFMLNTGDKADRTPSSIEPVKLNIDSLRPSGDGDRVSIRMVKKNYPYFEVFILQDGKAKPFDFLVTSEGNFGKFYSTGKNFSLPQDLNIYGLDIRILEFDPKAKTAKIEFLTTAQDRLMPVPADTEVLFRW